jgi:hypothetical protein
LVGGEVEIGDLGLVKETRIINNLTSSVIIYIFKPTKTNNENINGVDYNRQSIELHIMHFNSLESIVFNNKPGLRIVENSYQSPSVELVQKGYPGEPFEPD